MGVVVFSLRKRNCRAGPRDVFLGSLHLDRAGSLATSRAALAPLAPRLVIKLEFVPVKHPPYCLKKLQLVFPK